MTHTKFEEALEKAALMEGASAMRYEKSKNGTKFPYYYGVEVGFNRKTKGGRTVAKEALEEDDELSKC